MQLFVKCCADGHTVTLNVPPSATVKEIKCLLDEITGVNVDAQRLLYGLHPLDDNESLEEANIDAESTLFQSIELLGGAKKRKKKNFAKPKKSKHKKKKVKLAVLKFYKVDTNDNLHKLRKECPMKTCGPGVFMALHRNNRPYCGRCGGSFVSKEQSS